MSAHLRAQWRQRIARAGDFIYRGVRIELGADDSDAYYRAIGIREDERAAKIALDAAMDDREGLGNHWTLDQGVAERFANTGSEHTVTIRFAVYNFVPVIFEATYDEDAVETDPEVLREWAVQGYGWDGREEDEVPLKEGARVAVKAVWLPIPQDREWAGAIFEEGSESAVSLPVEWTRVPVSLQTTAITSRAAFGDSPEDQKALEDLANAILAPGPGRFDGEILPSAPDLYGGYITQDRSGRLMLDGEPVRTLYRVVHPGEWEEAQRNGYLQSNTAFSPGYTRASAKPDERWRYQSADSNEVVSTPGYTLAIDYDPADGWHASAEGYAATHQRIPLSRVHRV